MGAILLDLDAAAAALSIGRRTLDGLVDAGAIPVVRIGRMVRVRRAALEAWAERVEVRGQKSEVGCQRAEETMARDTVPRASGQSPRGRLVERVAV